MAELSAISFPPPPDDGAHLRHLLPSACAGLGLPGWQNRLGVPRGRISVVLVVDGLGDEQLARHTGHARFLASAWRSARTGRVLDSTVPSTTAAAISSLGTGLTPGEHGLVGYDVLSPEHDRVVNMLGGWDDDVDPLRWQPHDSVLSRAHRAGAQVLTVSRPKFVDSALTRAVLRGGSFAGASRMDARFRLALDAVEQRQPRAGQLRQGPPSPLLVYLYVDELDKTGHRHGVDSAQWVRALETLDAEAEKLAERLSQRFGEQASLLMTADHGMIDVAADDRLDITTMPELLAGVRHTAGEPRFLHLYLQRDHSPQQHPPHPPQTSPEPAPELLDQTVAAWEKAFGDRAWILTREQALASGWFGPAEPRVVPRIGDVLVAVRDPIALFHLERTGPEPLAMVGQHGSLTDAERKVPLLSLTGQPLE